MSLLTNQFCVKLGSLDFGDLGFSSGGATYNKPSGSNGTRGLMGPGGGINAIQKITISTSGMSKNIIDVLKFAKRNNIYSISLLGNNGGSAKKITNLPITVDSKNVARIQECHIFIGHILLEWVEEELLTKKIIKKIK